MEVFSEITANWLGSLFLEPSVNAHAHLVGPTLISASIGERKGVFMSWISPKEDESSLPAS